MKTFEKIYFIRFIEFRILRYVLHCSNFFGARLFFSEKNKRGGGGGEGGLGGEWRRLFGTLE